MKALGLMLVLVVGALAQQSTIMRELRCKATGGTSTAYACSSTFVPISYQSGILYKLYVNVTNTGSSTVAYNGLSAVTIKKVSGGALINLAAGDLVANTWVTFMYESPYMQMQVGSGGGGGTTMSFPANGQSGTTYPIVAGDANTVLTFNSATPVAATIAQAGTTGFPNGYCVFLKNIGAGDATITPTVSQVSGAANMVLAQGEFAMMCSNGTHYEGLTNKIVAGPGVLLTRARNGVTASVDTGYVPTKANLLSGTNPQICSSASGSTTTYTATCATALTGYSTKQWFLWYVDVANTGANPTLNIDGQGAKTVKKFDGNALAASDLLVTTMYPAYYDGTNIRVMTVGQAGGGGPTLSTPGQGYDAPWGQIFNAAGNIATATPFYQQFPKRLTQVVASVGVYVGSLASSKSIAVGIFDSTCVLITGAQGRITGPLGAGVQIATMGTPPTLVNGGIYYLGFATEDGTATIGNVAPGSFNPAFNSGSDARYFTGATAATGTNTSYAFAAGSCGAKTISNNPINFGVLLP